MKLTKTELVKLLSDHLGSDEDAVSSQLDKLIADIQKSISKGDPFVIQGFGSFTSTDEGISFEVSPAFAAEINYSYEGMLPIDVDGGNAPNSDTELETSKKPLTRKPVVIVDEDVEGEEDPFGLPDEVEEEVEFVDPVAFLDDLEGRSELTSESDEDTVFANTIDDDIAESETEPYGAVSSIDDTVDEEEKQLLESGISLIDDSDRESSAEEESLSDNPFGLTEAEMDASESSLSAEKVDELKSDDTEEVVSEETFADTEEVGVPHTTEVEEFSLDEPPKEVTDKTTTVLDEFFDPSPEPEQELEGVLHDSNDDVERLMSDGEAPVQEENGPRIVSIEEDEKDYSISFAAIFKWVAIVFVVVLIAGGAYWYFTGPGKSLFGTFNTSTVNQSVVTQPVLNESSAAIDENSITEDENESEIIADTSVAAVVEESDIAVELTPDAMEESSVSESAQPATDINDVSIEESNETEVVGEDNPQSATNSTGSSASYGLNGQVQQISGSVYSVIVHSLPSQISAQEQCNEISSLNLRCLVREATGPQGRTTYRVGIGQFDSIESAEAAIDQLPEPYRSRNFVARVN